jgi:hypothetical protein
MMPARTDSQQTGVSVRTIDTFEHGPLPVLDTWRDCRHTRTGWTAINGRGERLNIRYRPEDRWPGPARMPDADHAVIGRDAGPGEYGDVGGRVAVGAILIERAPRAVSKRSPRGGRGGK